MVEAHFEPAFILEVVNQGLYGKCGGDLVDIGDDHDVIFSENNPEKQVSKLKYVQVDTLGFKLREPKWYAGFADNDEWEEVSDTWVEKNFELKLRNRIKHESKGGFVDIPAHHAKYDTDNSVIKQDESYPKIWYKQKQYPYCACYSWASALTYFTDDTFACNQLSELADKWRYNISNEQMVADTNAVFKDYLCYEIEPYDPIKNISLSNITHINGQGFRYWACCFHL